MTCHQDLNSLNSASLYPPLMLPAVTPDQLKRGTPIQTRYFYADSIPGNKGKVVRFWSTAKGWYVRVNYGKNLGGQSLLKTMLMDALALA
ncbi:hypothetical protein ACTG16_23200 [Aeromonas sp. 23P]|uniref:hypothetical protein n=1 Tax=Aeromonas sp. 23P TaxID=3452716 RepID=UPI003F7A41A5|nr:hypothetical protein [Aeromonas veronii]